MSNLDKNQDFFNRLANQESGSIRELASRITNQVFAIGKERGLFKEDLEEIIWSSITILLLKIKEKSYVFQGYDPASFTIEIAKNKIMQFIAKHQRQEKIKHDYNPEYIYHIEGIEEDEEVVKLNLLLNKINPTCKKLIELKFFAELSDKEIVDRKLSPYSTTASLKNQRARCMKSLVEMSVSVF
ncbi:MAG: sigma-70 family RNA polymerase sigma factor [Saprospiraceae bacterium]|nr:sigma-70 family RNA polymerase sigma factor [Saprospiraceae bacterium]